MISVFYADVDDWPLTVEAEAIYAEDVPQHERVQSWSRAVISEREVFDDDGEHRATEVVTQWYARCSSGSLYRLPVHREMFKAPAGSVIDDLITRPILGDMPNQVANWIWRNSKG